MKKLPFFITDADSEEHAAVVFYLMTLAVVRVPSV